MNTLCLAALVVATASMQEKPPVERVAMSLRVVGPLDRSSAGEKGKNIDLYDVFVAFENTSDEPVTVFAPDIAKRPQLANEYRFKGRTGTPHHYSVRVRDARGEPVENAHFAVFVGGFASSLAGGEPPPRVCEYNEAWDLLRLDKGRKSERRLGYVMTRRGATTDFSVDLTLKTDIAEESDAEAQRMIRLAGPDKRELKCSAQPTPEPVKPAPPKGPQQSLPPPPPPRP